MFNDRIQQAQVIEFIEPDPNYRPLRLHHVEANLCLQPANILLKIKLN